jgi:hypothetical protein
MGGCLNIIRSKKNGQLDVERSWDSWQDRDVPFNDQSFRSSQISSPLNPNARLNRSTSSQKSSWSCVTPTFETTSFKSSINIPLTEVTSQLFLGTFDNAMNEEQLRAYGITHIISVIRAVYPIAGIQYKHNPMNEDGQSDLQWLMTTLWKFIESSQESGKALLVHSLKGQNRAATVVIAILMRRHGNKLCDAFKKVKNKRQIIRINEGYGRQLVSMELVLFGHVSVQKDWMRVNSFEKNTESIEYNRDSASSLSSTGLDMRFGITLNQYGKGSNKSNDV